MYFINRIVIGFVVLAWASSALAGGSIQGTVINALSDQPFPADARLHVEVLQCNGTCACAFDCKRWIDSRFLDATGRFTFPVDAGLYEVQFRAEEITPTKFVTVEVHDNAIARLGTVRISPSPVVFDLDAVTACDAVPTTGGPCPFRVTLINQTARSQKIVLWFTAHADGASISPVMYQIPGEQQLTLRPHERRLVSNARAGIPAFAVDGTSLCVEGHISRLNTQGLHFDALQWRTLFCVLKGDEFFVDDDIS